jgi:hypothetical protein
VNVIKRVANGYMVHREFGCTVSGASWGKTLDVALRRHYESDRRTITRAEQDRVAREYRARCAGEDARRLPS